LAQGIHVRSPLADRLAVSRHDLRPRCADCSGEKLEGRVGAPVQHYERAAGTEFPFALYYFFRHPGDVPSALAQPRDDPPALAPLPARQTKTASGQNGRSEGRGG
jgi:hypothetical protein